jgi:hypothetical protein
VTANPLPPTDPYAIKTNTSVRSDTTLAILESYVTQAEQDKGGLVPIVWHHLGTTNTSNDPNWMSLDTFAEFVQWLSQRPSTTVVKTMAQVIGGTERPYVAGPPLPTQSPNLVQNYSLEEATNGIPTGFQTGSAGTNTATWTYTTDAHTGGHAERVDITDFVSGDRKLVMRQDASTISPAATPGHTYLASVWGKGTGTAAVVMFYRSATDGSWKYWQQSPTVRLGSGWTQYNFTTVALPAGANAISFGLALTSNGSETVDDFGLLDQG